ncbi:MAG: ACT domain-containing protein, partial [Pseudomonadales bacterium]
PTGNAVVADLIDLHRQVLGPGSDALTRNDQPLKVLRPEETKAGFYLRITVEDRPGVMSAITTVLADFGISLDKILQEDAANHCATVALVTDPILQGVVEQAVAELEQHDAVLGKIQKIRVF